VIEIPVEAVRCDVGRALAEDIGAGDRTAILVPRDQQLQTRVVCRETAVLAGAPWFDACFDQLDDRVSIEWQAAEGDGLAEGQEVCRVTGPARAVLTGERAALNFLQTLSATATRARAYVRQVEGTGARILDTRKTLPGLRLAQKYAVRCGGAFNHRTGLFDAVLIKENHIAAAGSIAAVVTRAIVDNAGVMVEIEVESMDELREAVEAGAHRALLDNFPMDLLVEAVDAFADRIELEASGNIGLDSVRDVASTGVHYISVGDITKNVSAVDFSMRFTEAAFPG
jgi:nicotinate-nucleotide pyrophosphorylase (carboxylating)